jgi:hypothetical protein
LLFTSSVRGFFLFLWLTGSHDWRWFLKTRFWFFHLMGRFVDFNPFLFASILFFFVGAGGCASGSFSDGSA